MIEQTDEPTAIWPMHMMAPGAASPGVMPAAAPAEPPHSPLARGTKSTLARKIGKYELRSKLARGAFGVVFTAHDPSLDRDVAIKVLRPNHLTNEVIFQRFLHEARATARIAHPGIVTIHDCGQIETNLGITAYIAMELLAGESLGDRLASTGRLSADAAMEIVRQVASALEAAHRADVLHRDLKPDNVYLVPDPAMPSGERVKVFDFGLAKLGDHGHTRVDIVFGTPHYMSPEQTRSAAQVDHRSDIYALGCILFELVTGATPFDGPLREIVDHHQRQRAPRAASMVPDVPPELDQLIAQMLAKDPMARPQTMGAVQRELQRILSGAEAEPQAASSPSGTQRTPSRSQVSPLPAPLPVQADAAQAPAVIVSPVPTHDSGLLHPPPPRAQPQGPSHDSGLLHPPSRPPARSPSQLHAQVQAAPHVEQAPSPPYDQASAQQYAQPAAPPYARTHPPTPPQPYERPHPQTPAQQYAPAAQPYEHAPPPAYAQVTAYAPNPAPPGQAPAYPQAPAPGYAPDAYAQPPSAYAQQPSAQPSAPYAQPSAPHTQPPSAPYTQPPSAPYTQPPSAPYTQQPSAPYAQQPSAPYAQQPSAPYAQQPSAPYAQQPSAPYAQQPSAPYAQQPPPPAYTQQPPPPAYTQQPPPPAYTQQPPPPAFPQQQTGLAPSPSGNPSLFPPGPPPSLFPSGPTAAKPKTVAPPPPAAPVAAEASPSALPQPEAGMSGILVLPPSGDRSTADREPREPRDVKDAKGGKAGGKKSKDASGDKKAKAAKGEKSERGERSKDAKGDKPKDARSDKKGSGTVARPEAPRSGSRMFLLIFIGLIVIGAAVVLAVLTAS